jgi:hypothetical protein
MVECTDESTKTPRGLSQLYTQHDFFNDESLAFRHIRLHYIRSPIPSIHLPLLSDFPPSPQLSN